ncbi:glycosyltransferase family 4 protein [Candidatus Woesebacteria bacterium]|nr:MAG: glycosyltransferase family 4 protein [Candidatus Woesebacteria bacterium]
MNILVFSWRGPKHPLAGGAEQVMHEHMKGWVKAGHNVTLFTSNFQNALRDQELDGVRIFRRANQILGVHIAAFFWYIFGKQKYDVVVDQFHGIPFFTPFYVRKPKLAVLQEVARGVWLKNDLPKPLNLIVGIIGYLAEPFQFVIYRKVKFMVGSQSAKDELSKMRLPRKSITVVPHGTLITLPKPFPKKEKDITITFLGALAKDKGIEDAIKTFALINQRAKEESDTKNYKYWIIGKGGSDYVAYLTKLAKNLGIYEKTKFWGFVSEAKKFELLARSHILINPSILEGFGLVNIEANAVGTPVVAYTAPGLVDSVKDKYSGYLIKPNSPVNFADVIYMLVNDKKKYDVLVKGSRDWAEKFTWKKSRKLSLSLLENVARTVN